MSSVSLEEAMQALERFIEVNIVGQQSDLKYKDKRQTLAAQLTILAQKLNF